MPKKSTFLLRTDPAVLNALRRWANDELRSVNGQIEFILRRALLDAGRMKPKNPDVDPNEAAVEHGDDGDYAGPDGPPAARRRSKE